MSAELGLPRPGIESMGIAVPLPGEPSSPIEELLQVDALHNKPVRERLIADLKAIKKVQRAALELR